VDIERLPTQAQAALDFLHHALGSREPAIRRHVDELRARNLHLTNDQLAAELIRSTRRRVAATGALSGAAAIAPGLGGLLAIGTVTSQAFYALEQEMELVLGIAIIYGHELSGSDERVIEALVVIGIAGGAVKLREELLVAGSERVAVAAFRSMPRLVVLRRGSRLITRVLNRVVTSAMARAAARVVPLAVGVAAGAGFDWLTVSILGRAAVRYYGPGGPGARPVLLAPEDSSHVEMSD
jgi:hypothetical protein